MTIQVLEGDCRAVLATLAANSVHCCITSPPYWGLRDYGVDGMIGLEESFQDWLSAMVETFREVRRVLRDDGTLFLNLGDAYTSNVASNGGYSDKSTLAGFTNPNTKGRQANESGSRKKLVHGLKPKDLMMQPARVAIALQADGWFLRAMMPWLKRNPMPDSATDRPGVSTEYVFMLAKSRRYYWDGEAVKRDSSGGSRSTTGAKNYRGLNGREIEGGALAYDAETGRNFRAGDLFYSSLSEPHGLITDSEGNPLALDVNTAGSPRAHFAEFPPKLIEPLIKAGCPRGVCAECGAPWVREVVDQDERHWTEKRKQRRKWIKGAGHGRNDFGGSFVHDKQTISWSPSCQCADDTPRPATVLDPFGGAGTTGLVADQLGRHAILIELNPDYADMARRRIQDDAGMFADLV